MWLVSSSLFSGPEHHHHVLDSGAGIPLLLAGVIYAKGPENRGLAQTCRLHHGWQPAICQDQPDRKDRGTRAGIWQTRPSVTVVQRFRYPRGDCVRFQVKNKRNKNKIKLWEESLAFLSLSLSLLQKINVRCSHITFAMTTVFFLIDFLKRCLFLLILSLFAWVFRLTFIAGPNSLVSEFKVQNYACRSSKAQKA